MPLTYRYPPTGPGETEHVTLSFLLAESADRWVLVDLEVLKRPGFFKSLFMGG